MASRNTYLSFYRDTHQTATDVTVFLPPIKTDCTCITDTNKMSMLNSPVDYCSACGNDGYIETEQPQVVSCVIVDYVSESNSYTHGIKKFGDGEFDVDRYVLHCDQTACVSEYNSTRLAFQDAKEVKIDSDIYEILSIDKSKLLGQVRVHISRKN